MRSRQVLRPGTLVVASVVCMVLLWSSPSPTTATGGNSITSPDTGGDVGQYTSLALDGSGNPVISYRDVSNRDLRVLHCNDPNCAGEDESITSPDTGGWVGRWTSLALDADGYPVVSYWDNTNDDLKLLHCNDPNCSGGDESITSLDTSGSSSGWYTSLALDSSGYPVVSYLGAFLTWEIRVLHCNDPDCSGGDESITSPHSGFLPMGMSLALDSSGNPVVSYSDSTYEQLWVLHCNDPNCSGNDESITSPHSGLTSMVTSLALDSSGHPVVSYAIASSGDLRVLHCNDPNCTGGNESITSPDTVGSGGSDSSLALDASGNPVVSYYDHANRDLKVLHCDDPNCSGGDESVVSPDTVGDVGEWTSLALDSSGYPVVSYYDESNGDLKVLHCGDSDCTGGKAVGGVAEVPDEADGMALEAQQPSGADAGFVAGVAVAVLAATLVLTGVALFVRRQRGG